MAFRFAVVIPTYRGVATIAQTFASIIKQPSSSIEYALVVVIDGPNQELREIVDRQKNLFTSKGIKFTIEQFTHNNGRFAARKVGANLATSNKLLFIDDRVQLADGFFNHLMRLDESVAMPAVTELASNNVISKTMNLIRRRMYGDKWGLHFEDYYIDKSNFERSPKGTTCLWVDKNLFLDACTRVKQTKGVDSRFVNEDTKILRDMVEHGAKILRTAKLNVYYRPRDNFGASLKHLYERGPRFIDYYSQPKTRFFPVLISIYLIAAGLILAVIFKPIIVLGVMAGFAVIVILVALAISRSPIEFVVSIVGIPLISISFSLGVLKGTLLKAGALLLRS